MANAKFSIGQVSITQKLRIIAREVSNPLVEAANVLYDEPHPTQRDIIIDDLNPVPHYFDFYETPGGATVGTLLSTFIIDVGLISSNSFDFYEVVVDGAGDNDPAQGTNEYNNTELVNVNTMIVVQRGVGPRNILDEWEMIVTGGFRLLNGEVFNADDRWYVMASNKATQQVTVIGRTIFSDIALKDADGTLTSDDFNKLIEANGTADIHTLTFPSFSIIPDKTIFGFSTFSAGTQRYLKLQLPAGTSCRFLGEDLDILYLGKNENICLMKQGTALHVLWADGDFKQVGRLVFSDIAPDNSLPETGGWYDFDSYPRFFYWYVNKITVGQLGTATYPATPEAADIAKFIIDVTNSKFWMPDSGGLFVRSTDPNGDIDTERPAGDRKSGTRQSSQNLAHTHTVNTGDHVGISDNANDRAVMVPQTPGDAKTSSSNGGAEARPVNVNRNAYRII